MRPDRVWYLAYGSNVDRARFLRYLEGADPEPGARDATPPPLDRWARVPLRLRFAHESVRWDGGGVAFVDPDPSGAAIVRAWDITAEQFEDVFAQENRLPIGTELDWAALAMGSIDHGASWYRRLLQLDLAFASPEHPAVTFTWAEDSPPSTPHPSYVDTIRRGLAMHPELDAPAIDRYLRDAGA